jgi:hypothetical protein
MAKVRVYRYRVYNAPDDDYKYSTRMATKAKIDEIRGEMVEGSGLDIDESLIEDGWTEKNFNPGA